MKEKKRKRKKPVFIALCAVLAILIAMFVFFPPSAGKLPGRGAGGIAERTQVATDDGNLDIILLSDDISNPVLMVCGGGPGIPQYLLESMYPSALPEVFTVCYWDYRGTGASYRSDTETEMTTQRYIRDALAVTDYLSERFSSDRIFIMGHSFGTYLALKTVQAYPERYSCYIGMSQIVDQKQSEYLAFDYMKGQYEAAGNAKMVKRFGKYDIRASQQDYDDYFFSGLRDDAMHDLGVGTTRSMRSVISGIFFPSLRCTAYTQKERINIWRGKAASRNYPVTKDAIVFNAATDVPKLDVPVCFIAGKYDYTCCFSLQREYCEFIEAPEKTMYVFENSAHSPVYEEYEEGKRVLTEIRNTYRHQLRSAGDQ
jgi:pimeloyl-ACP methyl ester carboxylesterase